MVILLFAESRGLLGSRSLHEMHARLHAEMGLDERHEAWPQILALVHRLHEAAPASALFHPDATPFRGKIFSDATVFRVLDALFDLDGSPVHWAELDLEHLGTAYEGLMAFDTAVSAAPYDVSATIGDLRDVLGDERRRLGAHYTSRTITRLVVERALTPLLGSDPAPETILALRICDPSMGSGAFLLEVCRYLAGQLVVAWERSGQTPPMARDDLLFAARRLIAQTCLYGVDKNPRAAELARWSIWLLVADRHSGAPFLEDAFRVGDSLVGLRRDGFPDWISAASLLDEQRLLADLYLATMFAHPQSKALARAADGLHRGMTLELEARVSDFRARHSPFHWDLEFSDVFARGGFDAFVGNPPWVSYAGRAAQPLADDVRAYYTLTNPAFAGYRNLQGLFMWRCATMLRASGRLGLVLPSSMSELGGYAPSRRAHDELCVCDDDLPDFGDVFDDVFQPSMALLSTRRACADKLKTSGPWPLHRADLDAPAAALLARLSAYPKFPPQLFGERGFQSMGDDVEHLHAQDGPDERFPTGIRVGGDIEPFCRKSPRLYCYPARFASRFRSAAEWKAVRLLIRQTARFPLVALSDGQAFRNSILAGFSSETWSSFFLLAWLNSTPIRWIHYTQNRDARQGMPQVKIAHLRALPAPISTSFVPPIEDVGRTLGERNTGISPAEQAALDTLVADALDLAAGERHIIFAWSRAMAPKQS